MSVVFSKSKTTTKLNNKIKKKKYIDLLYEKSKFSWKSNLFCNLATRTVNPGAERMQNKISSN